VPAVAFGPRQNIPGVPPVPVPGGVPLSKGAFLAPSERGIKVADNENPAPQDRLYFNFNYFNNINQAVNERLGIDVRDISGLPVYVRYREDLLERRCLRGFPVAVNNLSTASGTPV